VLAAIQVLSNGEKFSIFSFAGGFENFKTFLQKLADLLGFFV